jgi:hypothetical protein
MGGHPLPETRRILCSKLVNLQSDLSADENGMAIHEECYVKRIAASS